MSGNVWEWTRGSVVNYADPGAILAPGRSSAAGPMTSRLIARPRPIAASFSPSRGMRRPASAACATRVKGEEVAHRSERARETRTGAKRANLLFLACLAFWIACGVRRRRKTRPGVTSRRRRSRAGQAGAEAAAPRPRAPATARLNVVAPQGAVIELGGQPRGMIGGTGQYTFLAIAPGDYQLSVQADGYEPWSGTVTVAAPSTSFEVPLRRRSTTTGRLSILVNEPGTRSSSTGSRSGSRAWPVMPSRMTGSARGRTGCAPSSPASANGRRRSRSTPARRSRSRSSLSPSDSGFEVLRFEMVIWLWPALVGL